MNKEEIIKSLQHTIDWMEQHNAKSISVTQHTGCGGYKEVDTLCDKIALKEALKLIEEQKTGRWIKRIETRYERYSNGSHIRCALECSNCYEEYKGDYNSPPNYCPNCGTRMDVEK